jgi:hypothetical protein
MKIAGFYPALAVFAVCAVTSGCARVVADRQPVYNWAEADLRALHTEVSDSTKFGQKEPLPWQERYWGRAPNRPFLGRADYYPSGN